MAERIRQLRSSDMGELVVAQQTTEAAIDSLYDPVLVTDAEGCVTKLNPAAEEIFGPEEEYRGKHVEEVARDSRIAAPSLRLCARNVRWRAKALLRCCHWQSTERSEHFVCVPRPCVTTRIVCVGAVTLIEDITHLREIDRLKSDFIATASHELRTPLTSVQMGVHLLLEGAVGELTDKQAEVLQACRQDCERLIG